VYIASKEGVLVHKAIVNREKDRKDLKILKGDIDVELLKEIATLRGKRDEVFNTLNKVGYNLK